jgi:hypothetical protein
VSSRTRTLTVVCTIRQTRKSSYHIVRKQVSLETQSPSVGISGDYTYIAGLQEYYDDLVGQRSTSNCNMGSLHPLPSLLITLAAAASSLQFAAVAARCLLPVLTATAAATSLQPSASCPGSVAAVVTCCCHCSLPTLAVIAACSPCMLLSLLLLLAPCAHCCLLLLLTPHTRCCHCSLPRLAALLHELAFAACHVLTQTGLGRSLIFSFSFFFLATFSLFGPCQDT